jgi:glycosyl transferase family 1
MRLLCVLAGGPDHPSSRFRILQHLETLRARGVEVETFVAKRRGPAAIARLVTRARAVDAVLIQKKLFAAWKLRMFFGSTPLLFDMDDAYFAVSPDEKERFGEPRASRRAACRARRLDHVLRRARRTIVGNHFLAGHAAGRSRDTVVLPTAVDLMSFPERAVGEARARRRAAPDRGRIGWIGSRPSLRYLGMIAAPLREICARTPGVRLVQICDEFADLPGVATERRSWSAAREAADLMDLDVGVMPLDDSPFSRGKCGFKILQYHAAGLPVVCSPVGTNPDLVADGVTGFLARTPAEWVDRLTRLLADPTAAEMLGERGRRQVRERYDASIIGPALAEIVLAAARPAPPPGTRVTPRA